MGNYGKILRNFVIHQNKINDAYNPSASSLKGKSNYEDLLSFNTINALAVCALNENYDKESMSQAAIDARRQIAMANMVVLEVFVDAYKILNLREKLDIINTIDSSLLEQMRNVKTVADIVKVLLRDANISLIGEAIRFSDLSVYDKVLQTKALEEKDVEFLKNLFPLFEGEYEAYNVEVSESFIARQIKKWQKQFSDVEKSYEDAANFLDQYSLINMSLYTSIAEDVEYDCMEDTKTMLKKFMETR